MEMSAQHSLRARLVSAGVSAPPRTRAQKRAQRKAYKLYTSMLMTECFADALVVFAGKAVSVALDSSLSTAVQAHPALQEEAAGEHDEHGAPTTPHAVFVAECAEDTLKGVGLAAVLVYWLLLSGAIVALLELVRRRSRLLLGWQARWQSVRVLLTLALLVEVVGWTTISTTRALRSEYMRAHAKQGAREASEGTPNAVLVWCGLSVCAVGLGVLETWRAMRRWLRWSPPPARGAAARPEDKESARPGASPASSPAAMEAADNPVGELVSNSRGLRLTVLRQSGEHSEPDAAGVQEHAVPPPTAYRVFTSAVALTAASNISQGVLRAAGYWAFFSQVIVVAVAGHFELLRHKLRAAASAGAALEEADNCRRDAPEEMSGRNGRLQEYTSSVSAKFSAASCLGVVALGSEPEAPLAGALDLVGAVLTMLSAFATARVASLYFHLFFDNGDIDANSSIEEAAENGYYTVGRLYAALAALGFTLWFTARQFHGILQTTDAPEREGAGGVRRLTSLISYPVQVVMSILIFGTTTPTAEQRLARAVVWQDANTVAVGWSFERVCGVAVCALAAAVRRARDRDGYSDGSGLALLCSFAYAAVALCACLAVAPRLHRRCEAHRTKLACACRELQQAGISPGPMLTGAAAGTSAVELLKVRLEHRHQSDAHY